MCVFASEFPPWRTFCLFSLVSFEINPTEISAIPYGFQIHKTQIKQQWICSIIFCVLLCVWFWHIYHLTTVFRLTGGFSGRLLRPMNVAKSNRIPTTVISSYANFSLCYHSFTAQVISLFIKSNLLEATTTKNKKRERKNPIAECRCLVRTNGAKCVLSSIRLSS